MELKEVSVLSKSRIGLELARQDPVRAQEVRFSPLEVEDRTRAGEPGVCPTSETQFQSSRSRG